ncbi:MAG TPA: hypothetical protein VJK29_23520 [Terriglobales bacterium]|nr:hypothetical protein [Terriglobales bacterium]
MESQLVFGYVLYVNGQAMSVGRTLEESQEVAEQYLNSTVPLRIVSTNAPAPMRTWNYDYAIQIWVELVRG